MYAMQTRLIDAWKSVRRMRRSCCWRVCARADGSVVKIHNDLVRIVVLLQSFVHQNFWITACVNSVGGLCCRCTCIVRCVSGQCKSCSVYQNLGQIRDRGTVPFLDFTSWKNNNMYFNTNDYSKRHTVHHHMLCRNFRLEKQRNCQDKINEVEKLQILTYFGVLKSTFHRTEDALVTFRLLSIVGRNPTVGIILVCATVVNERRAPSNMVKR